MRLRHLYLIREFQFSRVHHVVGRPVPIAVQPALRSKASFGISCSRWRPFASPARTCGATSVSRRHEARFLSQASKAMEPWHRAFVALGSNIGDRFAVVEKACKSMESQGDIRILRTSGLWETDAMYFENQDRFLNGACEIETSLGPFELLDRLQSIEQGLGRVKLVDKGPRNIDLDILMYDQETIDTDRLVIPHRLMLEREFVLRPLTQLIPNASLPQGSTALKAVNLPAETVSMTVSDHLARLKSSESISTLTPLSPNVEPLRPLSRTKKTLVMSIMNLTPDSFSDGGRHAPQESQSLSTTILSHFNAGAGIVDIGGQSTRPKAPRISPSEELARIGPALALMPNDQAFSDLVPADLPIVYSIDTFYASVARQSIASGAHIINDVSAGSLDNEMLPTLADLGCTVVLMHMRGTPETMTKETSYPDGVVETVAAELRESVEAAMKAGIRRWRIVLDPGIGFAKTAAQSLELLRRLPELRNAAGLEGLPWLIGTSRKGFVGKVTGVKEPSDRVWGTAATVAAAVQGGADIVRVHDVKEMKQVTSMSDAIWRAWPTISPSK